MAWGRRWRSAGNGLAWSVDREVRLGAAPNDAEALRDISSRDHRRAGLSEPEAKIIHLVLRQGEAMGAEQAIANVGNVYLARLVATGLVDHRVRLRDHNRPAPVEPGERLRLTAQVRDALRVKP